MSEVRIALVGGAPLLQAGIVAALESDDRLRLVARVEGVERAGDLLRQSACDVLVLDTQTPREDVLAVLGEHGEHEDIADWAKVVVLTDDASQQDMMAALQAGVRGYGIRSTLWPEDIRAGLLAVGRGLRWICPQAMECLYRLAVDESAAAGGAGHHGPLSPREGEVLHYAANGWGEDQIAARLTVSRNTVKTYLRRIRDKLRVDSREDAVRLGYEQGLIEVGAPAPLVPVAALRPHNGVA